MMQSLFTVNPSCLRTFVDVGVLSGSELEFRLQSGTASSGAQQRSLAGQVGDISSTVPSLDGRAGLIRTAALADFQDML